jgi:transposase-like protein
MTPRQFSRRFRSERDCLRYVIKRKWPDGFRWPRCDHDQAWLIPSRRKYQCKGCLHQTTLTANTIFHKTRKPLRDWFWAIYLAATRIPPRREYSARQLQHDLGLSYQTAWSWCHEIRKALEDRDTRYNLRGLI